MFLSGFLVYTTAMAMSVLAANPPGRPRRDGQSPGVFQVVPHDHQASNNDIRQSIASALSRAAYINIPSEPLGVTILLPDTNHS